MQPRAQGDVIKGVTCAVALIIATPAAAETRVPVMANYEVRLVGTVRAVDRHTRRLTVAYAPLETAPGGVRVLVVVHGRDLRDLARGDAIAGVADTRHSPWTLRDIRVLP